MHGRFFKNICIAPGYFLNFKRLVNSQWVKVIFFKWITYSTYDLLSGIVPLNRLDTLVLLMWEFKDQKLLNSYEVCSEKAYTQSKG